MYTDDSGGGDGGGDGSGGSGGGHDLRLQQQRHQWLQQQQHVDEAALGVMTMYPPDEAAAGVGPRFVGEGEYQGGYAGAQFGNASRRSSAVSVTQSRT